MDKNKLSHLPVRARQILHGDGESTTLRTVLCPSHGHAVAVTVCGECERCEEIGAAPNGELQVSCRPEAPLPSMRYRAMLRRILPSTADRVAISEVMSRDVVCVTRDVDLEALTSLFLERKISAAPVVDEKGYPIGLVSKTDLVRDHFENGETGTSDGADAEVLPDGMHIAHVTQTTVADVMMPLAYTLQEDDPLSRAAAVMAVERVHHLPVVSADGRVVGILSSWDFVSWVARQSAYADQA